MTKTSPVEGIIGTMSAEIHTDSLRIPVQRQIMITRESISGEWMVQVGLPEDTGDDHAPWGVLNVADPIVIAFFERLSLLFADPRDFHEEALRWVRKDFIGGTNAA